jgi:orotidine-5'-phosphate decarboxylase
MQKSKVVVALDFNNKVELFSFVDKIQPQDCRLKIGKEMFTYFGPELVKQLIGRNFEVFLDLKFHDIPNTVAKAVTAAADMGVWMVNVHASGGMAMMQTAQQALTAFGADKPLLIAVTVLTSMSEQDLLGLGISKTPAQQVLHLASLTQQAGLDGVVCSAWEAQALKQTFGSKFKLVTPGIRPEGSAANDQKRIMTPTQAVQAGVDYLVIGRPITQAADPKAVLDEINLQIRSV